MDAKKYFYSTLSMTLFLLLVIAGFNYWQDPANLFVTERHYNTYTKALAEGHIIAIKSNYDERVFKKSEIVANTHYRDVVILGSSRVMAFSKENLGHDLEVENLGVSGAVLEDDIIMWNLYQKANGSTSVKTIIIDAAPWLFNKNHGEVQWKTLRNEFYEAMCNLGKEVYIPYENKKVFQLISIDYTQASYRAWKKNKYQSKPPSFFICDDIEKAPDNWAFIYPDGSREWPRYLYDNNTNDRAIKFTQGKIKRLDDYEQLDNELLQNFDVFINALQSQGIKLVLYFPPYHPYVYDYLKDNSRYIQVFKAEQWLRNYAEEHDIMVIGSYNPRDMGLDGTDFLDGMHLKRKTFLKFAHMIE